jgi:hypothetical protein
MGQWDSLTCFLHSQQCTFRPCERMTRQGEGRQWISIVLPSNISGRMQGSERQVNRTEVHFWLHDRRLLRLWWDLCSFYRLCRRNVIQHVRQNWLLEARGVLTCGLWRRCRGRWAVEAEDAGRHSLHLTGSGKDSFFVINGLVFWVLLLERVSFFLFLFLDFLFTIRGQSCEWGRHMWCRKRLIQLSRTS